MTRWNSSILFPTDSGFINRITDATFGPSNSSGNPMITLELELLSPESVEIGGIGEIDISGVNTKMYYSTQTLNPDGSVNEEKSANSLKRCQELYSMLFPDDPSRSANFDPTNPDLSGIKGLCVFTEMGSDVEEKRKNPTTAQIEAAKKLGKRPEGDVMKNPVTGKNLINYWPKVRQIFGLAPANAAAGKPF